MNSKEAKSPTQPNLSLVLSLGLVVVVDHSYVDNRMHVQDSP